MNRYKRWFKTSSFSIIIIVILISLFNYRVDSLGIFNSTGYLSDAAKTLTNGTMIAGLENYDERLFQELIIKNLKVKNSVISIGSSRTMQLRREHLSIEKINYFNHSVSGASLEDYISIVSIYDTVWNYIPNTVILGIDPWIFNKNNNQNRWKVLSPYYNSLLMKMGEKKKDKIYFNLSKWKQLFNYDTTIANIKMLQKVLNNNGKIFYQVQNLTVDSNIKTLDGSTVYPYKYRSPNSKEVEVLARDYVKGNVYSLENFNALDNQKIFEKFIKYLQLKKVRVVFFLHPYNPISYDLLMLNTKYKNMNHVEEYLRRYAKESHIEIYGSYNPLKYRLSSKDFFDGMHGLEEVSKKIFTKYRRKHEKE